MTEFRQHLAPLSHKAWERVQEQARETLAKNLAGRRLVDMKGPKGMKFHAVGTGHLEKCEIAGSEGVEVGVRQVVPVIELRKSFTLNLDEFDALARGAHDIDLDNLIEAAKSLASTEDKAVFYGLEQAGITGMLHASTLAPQPLSSDPGQFMKDLATGINRLRTETVEGAPTDSFHFVISPQMGKFIDSQFIGSHSLRQEINKLIGGKIYISNALEHALLVNTNSGNYELTLAQDFTMGYEHHDADTVTLFLMEAFTFLVLNPEAALALHPNTSPAKIGF